MPPTTLSCPACSRDFHPMPLRGVEVDKCVGCGGLWFDGGELAKAARGPLPTMKPLGVSKRACPHCLVAMQVGRAADVEVDRCATCKGVYLDAGEFVRLVPISNDALHGKGPKTSGGAEPSYTSYSDAMNGRGAAGAAVIALQVLAAIIDPHGRHL
jgi:Zn-finger nucleic acid-binding protein